MSARVEIAGQASVYRLNSREITVEFTFSNEFKNTYLKCLEIGQDVRVPLYTAAGEEIREAVAENSNMAVHIRRLQAHRDNVLAALNKAEAFIEGFDGDVMQEGITELLAEIRAAKGGTL